MYGDDSESQPDMLLFTLDGRGPQLPGDETFWVAPNAMLIGDVRLDRDVGIWFGAVLRADDEFISIGTGSNVQDNSVLHADPNFAITVGKYCTIGHGAIVHGCTVGDNSLIGMGATILNGARIGRHCLIAASALVGENVVVPDNSLVRGVPGKVVGQLDDQKIALIRKSAYSYIAWWRRYRAGLLMVGG